MYMPYGSMATTKRTIRHIGVWSATKVGAVLTAVVFAIVGIFIVIAGLCGLLGSLGRLGDNDNIGGGVLAAGGVTFIFIYLIALVVYTIVGGIMGALYAWVYNITANLTGGLEIDVR